MSGIVLSSFLPQDKTELCRSHEETVEGLRARLREMDKRCELQTLQHEEAMLELEALRKKQHYKQQQEEQLQQLRQQQEEEEERRRKEKEEEEEEAKRAKERLEQEEVSFVESEKREEEEEGERGWGHAIRLLSEISSRRCWAQSSEGKGGEEAKKMNLEEHLKKEKMT